jgi:acetoin:2,6-dichlorophenolindophenol oxidoreductase subunit alpha
MHAADVSLGVLGANGIVGAGAPIAVGAAWAARQAGTDRVAMSFFGDGAVNQGVLLEALNLAALHRAAVVFVCENNGYAVTLPVQSGTAGEVTARAAAFGIRSSTVDGMDPEAVFAAAAEAVDRARGGSGPVFLEFLTYRFDAHHTRDHRLRLSYRTDDEVARWRARDPVLIQGQRLSPAARERIDQEVESVIADATTFARSSPVPESSGALDFLYATGLRPRMGMV